VYVASSDVMNDKVIFVTGTFYEDTGIHVAASLRSRRVFEVETSLKLE
jgi:hypothetical protein